MRAQAAAEQTRIAAVRKVCGDDHANIAAKAIAEGWDATRTELEVLRASRPKAPAAHIPDNGVTGTVLEAACLLTSGLAKPEDHCDEQALSSLVYWTPSAKAALTSWPPWTSVAKARRFRYRAKMSRHWASGQASRTASASARVTK